MSLPNGPYNPQESEKEMLEFWLSKKFYKPEYNPPSDKLMTTEEMKADARKAWALICPPPNAYARPHIGNISGYAYQDAMARYARMQGKKVLMLPGKDHAGLEGEGVFVREVLEKQGRNKFDMKREDFYKEMMEFFTKNMDIARNDERNIGLSADYDRDIFTLDPAIVEIVLDTFVEMYKDKMIYKGVRIVNWDPKARSVIADNQCEREERDGTLYYIKYPIVDSGEFITVATTRPETMFGDTAVAVNPDDKRHKDLIGKTVQIPLTEIEIPIITSFRVLTDFGTGALKITPAHAQDDYQIMQEWNSEHPDKKISYRNVIGQDLKLTGTVPAKYKGRKYKEAQPEIIEDLKQAGLFVKEEKIKQNILIAERTKAIVEPIISSQWYLKYDKADHDIKRAAMQMLEKSEVKIHPENMVQKFDYWMNNLRDWAISRSLWWGYRLPVWYAGKISEEIDDNGFVKEFIEINCKKEELDYSNPNHLRVQKHNPDSTIIDIVRHGQTDYNIENRIGGHSDAKLTEEGIKQAENFESDISYDIIITSDLGRASHTAELIAKKIGFDPKKIIKDQRLREKSFGDLEGLLRKEAEQKFPEYSSDIFELVDKHPELANVESIPIFEKRILEAFEEIKNKYSGKKILIVSHGGILRTLENKLKDKNYEELVKNPHENLALVRFSLPNENSIWLQDENVLDTWFSSGQWVYATLTKYNLMDTFFPTDVLVSASDILENWDSRMMMFTYFKYKKIPFKNLFLTGLVLGKDGQKMSKSRGNIVDIDKVKAEYGSDALRMAYFYQNSAGGSYVISDDKLKNFKQFNNKLWNAAKFVLTNFASSNSDFKNPELSELKLENSKEIFSHITALKEKITENIDNFEFGHATETLYQEFWHTFCDIQLENSKKYLNRVFDKETKAVISEPDSDESRETSRVLLFALKEYLKMLHPFIPFITEKIWSEVPKTKADHKSLMYTQW